MAGGGEELVKRCILTVLLSLALLVAGSVSTVALAQASRERPAAPVAPTVVEYSGRMVDENGRPVSGVYPISFKLFGGTKSSRLVWSDRMWVSVVDGAYSVGIGASKLLPRNQDFTKLTLVVEIKGVELSRQPFMDAKTAAKVAADMEKKSATVADVKLMEGKEHVPASNTGSVKYADSAGYAVSAEHANNCDRLQNFTADDLVKKVLEEGGGGQGPVAIGRTRRYGDRVGGPGGDIEYNEVCPKGYVMVGVRGGAGKFLDSIQIVCAPLGGE